MSPSISSMSGRRSLSDPLIPMRMKPPSDPSHAVRRRLWLPVLHRRRPDPVDHGDAPEVGRIDRCRPTPRPCVSADNDYGHVRLALEMQIRVVNARSLKDKRQIVKSVLEGARRRFAVSASEVGATGRLAARRARVRRRRPERIARRGGHRRRRPLRLVAPRPRDRLRRTDLAGVAPTSRLSRRVPRPTLNRVTEGDRVRTPETNSAALHLEAETQRRRVSEG